MEQVPIIKLRQVSKTYDIGGRKVLDRVDLDIYPGEFFVMLGKSGSGKSTLLNLISGIDQPDDDQAQIIIDETDITTLNDTQLTLFRRDHIGIIFQFFNLIPTLTVMENVTLPLELNGMKRKASEKIGQQLLDRVGLGNRSKDFPDKLSGGEQQRVAIARALAHSPKIILADEPTGNLDEDTSQTVLALLLELTRDSGKTLIMATHNPEVVPLADRVCRIHEGHLQVTRQSPVAKISEIFTLMK
ncbi:MAG: ABC transporter ATP-binding protein [Phototrophicales bacterium]|nr:MAG: ABC transporter ATP-binding protein [Phototrophicales bacterium]